VDQGQWSYLAEREARARTLYAGLHAALARAEERYQRAKAALEAARSCTEEVGLLVRLAVGERALS
jgi:phage shock protein A